VVGPSISTHPEAHAQGRDNSDRVYYRSDPT